MKLQKNPSCPVPWMSGVTRVGALAMLLAAMAMPSRAGVALRLWYADITGTEVSDLTSNPAFPSSPFQSHVLTNLVIPMNVADNYGSWIRGFIEAPQTGQYTFWIAAVDSGEFWLSSNEDPAGKTLIAQNTFTLLQGPNDWFLSPLQQSAPVSLVQGQKYYFELLHKEDNRSTQDSASVAWLLPDGTFQGPIPSTNLWPFPVDLGDPGYAAQAKPPQVLTAYNGTAVDALTPSTIVSDGSVVDLTATVEASQPAVVQWYSNGVAIPNANLLTYRIATATPAMNGAVYTITVTNALGGDAASTTLSVTSDSTPPSLMDVVNLANAAGDVAVVFSKLVDPATATVPANYVFTPSVAINGAKMGASGDTVLLQTAGLLVGTAYTVTVSNVRDRTSPPNTIASGSSWPVEQDLAGWWRLDESTGTAVADSSGKGMNATLGNDAYPGYAGKVLRSVKFEGVNKGRVALPPGFSDYSTNGMTVSLWAYPTSEGTATANWARFIDFGNGAANENILFARTGGGNQVTFEVYNKTNISGGKVTSPLGSLILNQWHHWAATMDTLGNVIIYRDGVPLATGTSGVPTVLTRTNCYLGLSNWSGDGQYAGEMDDVRVYTRVLPPGAIAALAGGGGADDTDPALPIVSVAATVPATALKTNPPGVFTITRTGVTTNALTVQYALSGTATNGVAYNTLSGSVVIPVGTNAATVLVTPKDYAFSDPVQTVVLRVVGATAYMVALADSATVTIVNNDSAAKAIAALVDNGTSSASLDVWFSGGVAAPSATTVSNYTLINAPGVTITSATLGSRNLQVVLGLDAPVPAGASLSVQGANVLPSTNAIYPRLAPVNLVADKYNSPTSRAACYALATDGVVDLLNNANGFDTYRYGGTEFAGLIYGYSQDFQAVKVDLGCQFGDGGSWMAQPKVYILKNPVDSNQTRPEIDPANWAEVPAVLISGSVFKPALDPSPSPASPIVFDLSGLSAAQRTGYGWAVGGVQGQGAQHFISISELRGYGSVGTTPSMAFAQPKNVTVTAGQRAKFAVIVKTTVALDSLTFQWSKNGSPLSDGTTSAYATPPAAFPSDNDSSYVVEVTAVTNGNAYTFTSQPAILTVLARTNPPVVAATYDPSNRVVEVWFNGSTDPTSSQTIGNYTLSDSSVTIGTATQIRYGCGVVLALSGAISAANPTLTVNNVLDSDGNLMPSQTVDLLPLVPASGTALTPTYVVANAYQQNRTNAFLRSTDGVVINDANVTTWTTWDGNYDGRSDFVGLRYTAQQVFGVVKVDLGWQFGDGGDWSAQPKIYILKKPVDTNQRAPETDPQWICVPATMVSANIFDGAIGQAAGTTPLLNSPIVFDLTHLPLAQRTGWGWAMGGVPGNAMAGAQFVTIAEARAFGVPASTLSTLTGAPQIMQDVTPASVVQSVAYPFNLSVPWVVGSTPLSYQWQKNGANLTDNGRITGSQSATLSFFPSTMADTGNYRLIVANSFGSATSSVAPVTIVPCITFNGNGTGWTINKSPSSAEDIPITNNVLTLTHGMYSEGRSCFLNNPVTIDSFVASYTFQDVWTDGADAAVFVLQNTPGGPAALGALGGSLGFAGITPSVGLQMDVYYNGMRFRNNGATGTPYDPTTPVSLAGGHPINFLLKYYGSTLSVTMTDAIDGTTFRTNYTVTLPTVLGARTAYVGFTGASGAVSSYQQISNFVFYNRPRLMAQAMGATGILLSWPASPIAMVLQEAGDAGSPNWSTVTTPITVINGQNRVLVSPDANRFYRLVAP